MAKKRANLTLPDMTHCCWGIPVMALMHEGEGARFTFLQRVLKAPKESVRNTIKYLMALGLIEENPGYGHPLRPDYLLTKRGAYLGKSCLSLFRFVNSHPMSMDVIYKKWSLPVVQQMSVATETRFSDLRKAWKVLSPRAATLALKELQHAGLITRAVTPTSPPSVSYRLTPTGVELGNRAKDLVAELGKCPR